MKRIDMGSGLIKVSNETTISIAEDSFLYRVLADLFCEYKIKNENLLPSETWKARIGAAYDARYVVDKIKTTRLL